MTAIFDTDSDLALARQRAMLERSLDYWDGQGLPRESFLAVAYDGDVEALDHAARMVAEARGLVEADHEIVTRTVVCGLAAWAVPITPEPEAS
ncbi:hypothetical protein DWB68_15125 [Galactobacter valiniphilus]|uniref:Uncharacterized protein n=1 Tax=Galactobacter valiniphilus TaxID=2676122 RepID=A0A399J9W7_9MICC|nr:hypothetical protein [Galactobacter valiniphilus]RII40979.1 hypothetical protein DWB68_15125 [Galactobacter valiniphilus]